MKTRKSLLSSFLGVVLAVSVLAVSVLAVSAVHGARLGAPSDFLRQEPYRIAVVETKTKEGGERVVFAVRETLRGDAPEAEGEGPPEITVRMNEEAYAEAAVGRSYVLGYTTLRPVGRLHGVYEDDPLGPSAVALPAVGDALLDDTPATRLLASGEDPKKGDAETRRKWLDAVVVSFGGPRLTARFAGAELTLREELREQVTAKDFEALTRAFADPDVDPLTRDILLRAGELLAPRFGAQALAAEARRLFAAHGPDVDLETPVPALLVTAARILRVHGEAGDFESLARHLESANPGVAAEVLKTLDVLDPEKTRQRVAELVAQEEGLHPEALRVMRDYLR